MGVALPSPVRPRIGQFVRLLASDRDGEVIAAVRAIGRALKGVGADFHDLADVVEREPAATSAFMSAPFSPPPHQTTPPVWDQLKRTDRLRWLDTVIAADWPSEWHRDFAADMRSQVWCQPHKSLTPKQRAALDALIAKAWWRATSC